MGFLLDKCKLKKMDDEILSICHPFTCGDEDLDGISPLQRKVLTH